MKIYKISAWARRQNCYYYFSPHFTFFIKKRRERELKLNASFQLGISFFLMESTQSQHLHNIFGLISIFFVSFLPSINPKPKVVNKELGFHKIPFRI